MPSRSLLNVLYDIRDNILYAQEFVATLDYDAFVKSRRDVYAVTRAIEIVSEASKHLPEEMRARHPQMPWRDIRDVGNFYRHQYDNVSAAYVWRTVQDHLPSLLAVVHSEIALLNAGE
jgi:uncharacterized protein with HEPN domain